MPPSQYTQYPQQPPPGYPSQYPPPQQPYFYGPPPQPPKPTIGKCGVTAIVLASVFVLFLCGLCAFASTHKPPDLTTTVIATTGVTPTDTPAPTDTPVPTDTPAPTDTPTPAPQLTWKTTHTFTGSGIKKTAIFGVVDDWKIQWKCDPSSFYGSQYNVQVYVYGSDNSLQGVAINELCKPGNTIGETEEHQGGSVYLDINSEGSWTITLQELK